MIQLFLERTRSVDRLVKRLEREKLVVAQIQDSDDPHIPARMILSIPWGGEIELLWHRWWEPEGMLQEDTFVSLRVGSLEERVFDFERVDRKKFEKPLDEVVIDRIAAAVRKHVRGPSADPPLAGDAPSEGAENDNLP